MDALVSVGQEMTVSHVSNLSLPSLTTIGSTFSISETDLNSISVPKLQTLGRDLILRSNEALNSVSFPLLDRVQGTFLVANNSVIAQIDVSALKEVGGSVEIDNDVTSMNFKPERVNGAVNIKGSGFDCQNLEALKVCLLFLAYCRVDL
jgi:hypothetical protein